MTYLIYDIKFYKVDDDGKEVADKNGNIKLFEPEEKCIPLSETIVGYKKFTELENFCNDTYDGNFREIHNV